MSGSPGSPGGAAPATAAGAEPAPRPLRADPGAWLLALNAVLLSAFVLWHGLRTGDQARVSLIGDLAYLFFMLSLVILTWRAAGAAGLAPRSRIGWRLIALGGVSYLVGNAFWFYYEVLRGLSAPFPSLADLGYVGFYPPVLAGIACLIRPMEERTEQTLFWLDLAVIAIGAGALVWYFLLWPIALSGHEGTLALVLAEAYPLGATVLLVGATALMLKPWADRSRAPIAWLVAGLLTYFVADTLYAHQSIAKTFATGGLTDALYHLSAVLIMASAFLESRGGPRPDPARGPSRGAERVLAILPYAAVAAVYGLLLRVALGGTLAPPHAAGGTMLSGLVLAAVVIAALAMVRQSVAAREIARLQAERATRAFAARFASLVRHSSDLIALVGPDLRLRFASPAAERILGLTPEDLTDQDLIALVHPDDRPAAAAFMARVIDQGAPAARTEWRVRHAAGSWRYLETIATNLIADPAVGGVVLNGRDITERKRVERALEDARVAAEAASRAKTEFLTLMSHEIRTPLNAVLGLAQVLERGPLAPDQRDMVEQIRGAGRSLLAIINDILDLSRIEAGRMHIDSGGFELLPLLAGLDTLMGPTARDKGLQLHIGAPDPTLGPLLGDRQRLEQVLANLLGNAIKFTAQGQVELAVSAHAAEGSTVRLRFAVRDTGIGIPAETLGRLFTPFTQADAGITRRFGGTGLGLALSKRLVELMGGTIGVESTPGRGSTFWFELPFSRASADPLAVSDSPPGTDGPHLPDAGPKNRDLVERAPALAGPTDTSDTADAAPPVRAETPALDAERLAALREALGGHDLSALSLFSELAPGLRAALGQARTEALRTAVGGLRFAEALALLDQAAT